MLKWPLIVLAVIALLVAGIAIIGMFLPVGHQSARTVNVNAPPESVFALITDVERYSTWRRDVKEVTLLADSPGVIRFREVGRNGTVTYRVVDQEPPVRWVVRIDDPSLPYGGTWTYSLRPEGSGTSLTITEDGEVYNPIFRFLSRTVFSTAATIEAYQAALRARLDGGA
ncbi:MAG TPA: SRPBCC family protein [Gemmatimonadaceae bacterium]